MQTELNLAPPDTATTPTDHQLTSQDCETQRAALAAWSHIAEPTDAIAHALRSVLGPVAALHAVATQSLPGTETLPKVTKQRLTNALQRWQRRIPATIKDPLAAGQQLLATSAAQGIRLITRHDPEWPDHLNHLADSDPDSHAPAALWAKGPLSMAVATKHSVALVGSRAATSYGTELAKDFAFELAEAGYTVWSGAAIGVDGAAHQGALAGANHSGRSTGPTVAILGCGVDTAYPRSHQSLLERISEHGLIVSEYPPGAHVKRFRFLQRNRLLAALTQGTVVIEAAARSGALNTINHAANLGRPIGAVPGLVTSGASAGCHAVLRNHHATVITSAADIAELIGPIHTPAAEPATNTRPRDRLTGEQQEVLESIPSRGPADLDTIMSNNGLPPGTILAAAEALIRAGFITETTTPGGAPGWQLAGPTST